MRPVPGQIRLLSLDFDGTILDYIEEGPVLHAEVTAVLNDLRYRGTAWVANSGRSLEELREIVGHSTYHGLEHLPQAFLCLESMMYECLGPVIRPVQRWNDRMVEILRELHQRVQAALTPRLDEIRARFTNEIYIAELYAAFSLPEEGRMPEAFSAQLMAWLRGVEGATITRNGRWVAVHSAYAGKGNVLHAYSAHAGFDREEILAIGDHFNDLTMLDGDAAAFVGCPADAVDEVKEAVRHAGGHVAERPGPPGTAEVIRRFVH